MAGQLDQLDFSSLAVQGYLLYLSVGNDFNILDASDPRHLVTLASIPTPPAFYYSAVSVSGSRAVLASGRGLWEIDIADPLHPAKIGELQNLVLEYSGTLVDLSVEGKLATLAVGTANSGLGAASECILVDLSDPTHPAQISVLGANSGSYPSVVLLNQRAYFAGHDQPQSTLGFVVDSKIKFQSRLLKVLDLSRLPQVEVLSEIELPWTIYDVAYDRRYAYIADG